MYAGGHTLMYLELVKNEKKIYLKEIIQPLHGKL